MATGRTKPKWTRVYVDGFDMSGYARSVGPLEIAYDEADMTTLAESVKGYLPNTPQVNIGTLNTVFDNTATSGVHAALGTAGAERIVSVAMGIRGVPAAGDPCFCGQFTQGAYQTDQSGGVYVNIPFMGWAADATTRLYAGGWGQVLHPLGAETEANTANGFDNYIGNATAKGGYFIYHITAFGGTGSATLSVDDSANNSTWLALSGATSGAIAHTSMPASGIVALANNADVRRYLRFQVAITDLTSVTFFSAFVRAY
jgi:hypothetical protein